MPAFRPMDEDLLFDEHDGRNGSLHRLTCPTVSATAVLWKQGVAYWRPNAPVEHRGPDCWPRCEVALGLGMGPEQATG